jgi:hypothetical protein
LIRSVSRVTAALLLISFFNLVFILIYQMMVTKTENVVYNMFNNHINRVLTDGILLHFQFIHQ